MKAIFRMRAVCAAFALAAPLLAGCGDAESEKARADLRARHAAIEKIDAFLKQNIVRLAADPKALQILSGLQVMCRATPNTEDCVVYRRGATAIEELAAMQARAGKLAALIGPEILAPLLPKPAAAGEADLARQLAALVAESGARR